MNAAEGWDRSNTDLIMQLLSANVASVREFGHNNPSRSARTFYDHLAEITGLELMDTLYQKGWLED